VRSATRVVFLSAVAATLCILALHADTAGGGSGPPLVAAAPDSARVKELVGELLDDSYQTLPPDHPMPVEQLREVTISLPAQVAVILRFVLYSFMIVAVVLFAIWAYDAYVVPWRRGDRTGPRAGIPGGGPEGGGRGHSFLVAERLVAEKRFGEAIHALLLAAIDWLNRARGADLPESFTSREVLHGARLDGDAYQALSKLVAAVEVVHFGGAGAAYEDYQECLTHYNRLLGPDPGGDA
jgi:hypothetical protein